MGKPATLTDTSFALSNYQPVYCEPSVVDVVLNQASAVQSANGNTVSLSVGQDHTLFIGINLTALGGTSPTAQFFVDTLGADGVWYQIWASATMSGAGQVTTSIGPGLATTADFGDTIRLRWSLGGTSPTATFSASIKGKQAV
jgi:hypothetical protein